MNLQAKQPGTCEIAYWLELPLLLLYLDIYRVFGNEGQTESGSNLINF